MSYLAIPIAGSAIALLAMRQNRFSRELDPLRVNRGLMAFGLWLLLAGSTAAALLRGFTAPVKHATAALVPAVVTSIVLMWQRMGLPQVPLIATWLLVLVAAIPVGLSIRKAWGSRLTVRRATPILRIPVPLADSAATEDEVTRFCACGCGGPLPQACSPQRLYLTPACRRRAARRRASLRLAAARIVPFPQPADGLSVEPEDDAQGIARRRLAL